MSLMYVESRQGQVAICSPQLFHSILRTAPGELATIDVQRINSA